MYRLRSRFVIAGYFVLKRLPVEVWTLRDRTGATLCALPCERWVRATSGDYIDLSANGGTDHKRVDVSVALPVPPGTSVIVHPVTERGTPRFARISMGIMVLPYLGGFFFGMLGVVFCAHDSGTSTSCQGIGGMGVAGGVMAASIGLATAHLLWQSWTRDLHLYVEESSASLAPAAPAQVSLEPGAIRLQAGGVQTWFTPAGVIGSF